MISVFTLSTGDVVCTHRKFSMNQTGTVCLCKFLTAKPGTACVYQFVTDQFGTVYLGGRKDRCQFINSFTASLKVHRLISARKQQTSIHATLLCLPTDKDGSVV